MLYSEMQMSLVMQVSNLRELLVKLRQDDVLG